MLCGPPGRGASCSQYVSVLGKQEQHARLPQAQHTVLCRPLWRAAAPQPTLAPAHSLSRNTTPANPSGQLIVQGVIFWNTCILMAHRVLA